MTAVSQTRLYRKESERENGGAYEHPTCLSEVSGVGT